MSPWLSERFLSSQSDERLAALATAGSERAFAVIVQRYRLPLLGFARRLGPSGDAEDLVQQTFMSALAALQSGVTVRHLRGWLHQILRHAAMRAAPTAAPPAGAEQIEWATDSAQHTAELRLLALEALAALAQLPDRQQEAMVATAIHGQSRAEVAQLLGLSEGAVRQLVHRARETLRTAVTALTPYPLARALAAGSPGGGVADVLAGAGAGSAGALTVKVGGVVVSGLVATGIVTSGVHGRSHSAHRAHGHAATSAAVASPPPRHSGAGPRLAAVGGGAGSAATINLGGESRRGRGGGPGPSRRGCDGGPGTSSDGSPGGLSPSSGSSDGGGSNSGSPGGPTATTATSSDGGSGSHDGGSTTTTTTTTSGSDGGSGSGSKDGGRTTTTTSTTATTTSGSSDGGSSGGSGSGDTTTTTTTGGH